MQRDFETIEGGSPLRSPDWVPKRAPPSVKNKFRNSPGAPTQNLKFRLNVELAGSGGCNRTCQSRVCVEGVQHGRGPSHQSQASVAFLRTVCCRIAHEPRWLCSCAWRILLRSSQCRQRQIVWVIGPVYERRGEQKRRQHAAEDRASQR